MMYAHTPPPGKPPFSPQALTSTCEGQWVACAKALLRRGAAGMNQPSLAGSALPSVGAHKRVAGSQ